MQSRLRWHLVQLCRELEASLKPSALSHRRELDRVDRRLRRLAVGVRARVARELVSQIRQLTREIDALEQELLALIKAQRPWLLEETGCGALVARAWSSCRQKISCRWSSCGSSICQRHVPPVARMYALPRP